MKREKIYKDAVFPQSANILYALRDGREKNRMAMSKYIFPCCHKEEFYILDKYEWEAKTYIYLLTAHKDGEIDFYELSKPCVKKILCLHHRLPLKQIEDFEEKRVWMIQEELMVS